MENNLKPLRDWTALESSAGWLPSHRSTVALSLLHDELTIGTDLADRWSIGAQRRKSIGILQRMNCSQLGHRLLASLSKTPYETNFLSEIQERGS